jgi:glycosyltransferase involved in cell wall biosynthesis
MLRVMAYTGGEHVPSARFRIRQYIPELRRLQIDMRETPALFGSYPPINRVLRPGWGIAALAERIGAAVRFRGTDVTILQREMLSTFATAERLTKAPRVLDVDDAIWLYRGGRFAAEIARRCQIVICGNAFIADFFQNHSPTVVLLPTPVDTERFRPATRPPGETRVICWSGTSSGLRFLYEIESALAAVLAADPKRRLRVVCDTAPRFQSLPTGQLEFVPWSRQVEVAAIQTAAVGIMPLNDSDWARGKCSYKLLTYMACGLPVVATPVGMNKEILARADAGSGPCTTADWVDALESILHSPDRASEMGAAGREMILRDYSLRALAPRFAKILQMARAGEN